MGQSAVRLRGLALAAMVTAACGGGGGSAQPTYPFPEPRSAKTASEAPATRCAPGVRYDEEAGCLYAASDARLRVEFRDEIPPAFVLIAAAFAMDGALMFESNDPALLEKKSFAVTTSGLAAGKHELAVRLIFRGNGYGVFSYLRGYRFQVQSVHSLDAKRGSALRVSVVAYERGTLATPIEQRPSVRFE